MFGEGEGEGARERERLPAKNRESTGELFGVELWWCCFVLFCFVLFCFSFLGVYTWRYFSSVERATRQAFRSKRRKYRYHSAFRALVWRFVSFR